MPCTCGVSFSSRFAPSVKPHSAVAKAMADKPEFEPRWARHQNTKPASLRVTGLKLASPRGLIRPDGLRASPHACGVSFSATLRRTQGSHLRGLAVPPNRDRCCALAAWSRPFSLRFAPVVVHEQSEKFDIQGVHIPTGIDSLRSGLRPTPAACPSPVATLLPSNPSGVRTALSAAPKYKTRNSCELPVLNWRPHGDSNPDSYRERVVS